MTTWIISYDLRKPGRDYASLHAAIKSLGAWAHPLESFWAVISDASSEQIRDALRRHMDANDGLLVVRSGDSAAWANVADGTSEWLTKNL